MSGVFGNPWLYKHTSSFFDHSINQSLRFDDGDNANLKRDITSSGNMKTWTWSAWVKRANLGSDQALFTDGKSSSFSTFRFNSSDQLYVQLYAGASKYKQSNRVFRDTSAWYHFVWRVDTTQSTAEDRSRIYVNGTQITSWSTEQSVNEDTDSTINQSGNDHLIGKYGGNTSRNFDGYMAEVNFIDGTSLGPDTFGETKDGGVWIPKAVSGVTYGLNGFHLTFQGTGTATTSQGTTAQTNIGDDQSGAGNNFAVTALVASDVMLDTPTQNICVYNPLDSNTSTLSEGNLKVATASTSSVPNTRGTFAVLSGKWYWEIITVDSSSSTRIHSWAGLASTDRATNTLAKILVATGAGRIYGNSGNLQTGLTAWSQNDVIGVALDVDNTSVQFYRNGSTHGSAVDYSSFIPATEFLTPFIMDGASGIVCTTVSNFGQDSSFANNKTSGSAASADGNGIGDFYYAPPSGFLALANSNLPTTSISPEGDSLATDHFNTVLYTGNSTDNTAITSVGFQPDWVWVKTRSAASTHILSDSVRGATKQLFSNLTNAEQTDTAKIKSFDANGFTLGADGSGTGSSNTNTVTYAAWNWKAGGATPSKTYKLHVDSDGGQNKYRFRNSADSATFATYAPTVELQEGGTYVFDWSHSGAQGHPIRFSTTSDGTHNSGTEYTTGVVKDDSAYTTTITVAASAPTLYYYCQYHSGMGGQVNTNSTFGSSNFDGNIMSKVTVNKTSGFSIATFTMPDAQKTIGHGLGVKPDMIIFKLRSSGSWMVWHNSFGENTNNVVLLNTTAGKVDSGGSAGNWFRGITTTTTEIKTAGSYAGIGDYVMYSFSNVPGYQTVGSYVGNGSSDGTFVFTGFRPAWLIVKRSSSSGGWHMFDNKRSTFNEIDVRLEADNSDAENTSGPPHMDFLSNGFKMRTTFDNMNASGSTYIFLAFAEAPFKFVNAR